tara:strand:+ start:26 stop:424 length:399 start_codon:yes stop_codon:yes gene_type:complete
MGKHILYKLFRIGKLPKNIRRNKLTLFDEGIKIIAKYSDFKSPSKNYQKKASMMIGSILISKKRITAFTYSSPMINLKLKDKRIKKIDYSGSTEEVLSMHFDAATFSKDSSGMVTYLFYTPKAKEILQNINV